MILSWGGWFYVVFKIPPTSNSHYLFFLLLFLAVFLTLFILFKGRGQALIFSLTIVIFLILRLLKLTNFLNLVILAGIFLVGQIYLRQSKLK